MDDCRVLTRALPTADAVHCVAGSGAPRHAVPTALAVLLLCCGRIACAQTAATPYGSAEYEHDTNVFYLPSGSSAPIGKNGPTFADNDLRLLGGVNATYDWARQELHANAEVRRYDYDYFSYLNHNEYLADVGLDWKLGSVVDGTADYRRERRMVPFQELINSTQLFLETEGVATVSANVLVTPEWRLQSAVKNRALDSPRPDLLDLNLRENSIHEELRYLGVADLSAGFLLDQLWGRFAHDPTAARPSYSQTTVGGAANYAVSGLTKFNGSLGYTRRSDAAGGSVSGITGNLGYQRNLSGKTTLNINASRAVNSYVSSAGSEVDSTVSAALTWRITYKTSVNAGYTWTMSKFPQVGVVNGVAFDNRIDHLQFANAEADYQALHWLAVRIYARYQTRQSNLQNFTFDATGYGIEFQARLPKPR